MENWDIAMLPESCVSIILSLTSPSDACRCSVLSSTSKSAAQSDIVWEKFLPSDYCEIVSRVVSPLQFSSKKELFLCLSKHVLIDDGKKSFKLEKFSGRKCYMLSATELSITWSTNPMYWFWNSTPKSRFSMVAVLRTVCWLEIHGKIKTQMLSPNTTYKAYLIMNLSNRAYGLDTMPSEASIELGNQVSTSTVHLCPRQDSKKHQTTETMQEIEHCDKVPVERDDGWMEIELGEFFVSGEVDEEEEVKMSLMEVKGYQLKGGLIVEGIEVRPKQCWRKKATFGS